MKKCFQSKRRRLGNTSISRTRPSTNRHLHRPLYPSNSEAHPPTGNGAISAAKTSAEVSRKRPPLDRMKRIYGWLQDGLYPNCSSIALELEVSLRTARRDVAFMQERWSLPIDYDGVRHGYFFTAPVENFPGAPVTEAEVFALLVAHKAIEQYRGTPFQKPLEVAFEKLTGQLDREERYTLEHLGEALSFRPFAPDDADLHAFKLVTRALAQRQALTFDYRKPGDKSVRQRHVHPYHLTCSENRWYLLAYDKERGDIRKFVLGRMRGLALTGERFVKPIKWDPQKHLESGFGVMTGTGDYDVVIELDAWATDVLAGRKLHWTQQVTAWPDGGSQLRLRLSCLEEIEQWVLSWGAHARVVRPAQLAERVSKTAKAVAERYPEVLAPNLEAS
jgi:proteasome accessory factor B